MTMTNKPISIARQMRLLLDYTREPNTRPATINDLARAIGLTQQTLQNILQERIDNPRLFTLRALCVYYGISLDYFDLKTEELCRHYLNAQQLKLASPLIQQIQDESTSLIALSRRNILATLEWMREVLRPQTS
jgi:transcriptional regulator with XRE-family HTH domain